MHSGVLKVASFTSFTKKSLGYFEISSRLSTSWKNEDVLTQFSWKQAEKCCFPSKKKSVQLRLSHQTKPLFTSSPAAPVFVCRVPLRLEQGLCRTRVSKSLLTSRIFFSKERERRANSESSDPLPPAAPHFLPWVSLFSAMGQLGAFVTRGEMISPLGRDHLDPWANGRERSKEQFTAECRGTGGLSQGTVLCTCVKINTNAMGQGRSTAKQSLFRHLSEFTWLTEIFLLLQL